VLATYFEVVYRHSPFHQCQLLPFAPSFSKSSRNSETGVTPQTSR
jgi:hypothetical protein